MLDLFFVCWVVIVLCLLDLFYEYWLLLVFCNFEVFSLFNLMVKVFMLVLDDGIVLMDFSLIFDYLECLVGCECSLLL